MAVACAATPNIPKEFYYNEGVNAAAKDQFLEAEVKYRQAIEVDPNFFQAHNNLGVLLLKQGILPEAVSAFQKALSIKPDYLVALENLALVYEAMGHRSESALKIWEKAQSLEKRSELKERIARRIDEIKTGLGTALQPKPPALLISSPQWGAKMTSRGIGATERVEVVGTVGSDAGIHRIELWVDGERAETQRPKSDPLHTVYPFLFKPEIHQGRHTLTVKVYDTNNVASSRSVEVTRIPKSVSEIYGKSIAVVIGIDIYSYWPRLNSAVNDAKQIVAKLKDLYFDEIFLLTNEEATRENILKILRHELPKLVGPQDRVFIFFAGHGQTRRLSEGQEIGYIIPFDARNDNALAAAISMEELREVPKQVKAKHIFYAMDSCYSGSILTAKRSAETKHEMSDYLSYIGQQRAVEMLMAGGAGQVAIEKEGHGLFTKYLLQGLEGKADLNRDGTVTGSELGLFVRPLVSNASGNKQTPIYGRLDDNDGEMIFVP